jgi:hypothetical protein
MSNGSDELTLPDGAMRRISNDMRCSERGWRIVNPIKEQEGAVICIHDTNCWNWRERSCQEQG